ncbi:hypothetical protein CANMA_003437 [Candida margitis]|uniref:uncharacterized protein n=1 Tax=Candida margitis TaxID=1775924 RepID=UPI002225B80F|nr:uncharacterized protein CANMA_003437 [Candida margitis]KAI5964927.1 hypothetical protein CANMA_003437 [Candida margitis]
MSIQQERNRILKSLEHDFINDLSLHLYSTFLLHRVNPNFPLTRWASWPKEFSKVPIPEHKYEDDLIDEDQEKYERDIDEDHDLFERDKEWQLEDAATTKRRKTKRSLRDVRDEEDASSRGEVSHKSDSNDGDSDSKHSNDSDDDHGSDDGNDDDDENNEYDEDKLLNHRNKIIEVSYTEKIPSAKISLMNSINSILETKIHNKINQMKQDNEIDSGLHFTDSFPKNLPIVSEIANRFNTMLETMFDTFHLKDYPLNWHHVLIAGMINDRMQNRCNRQLYEGVLQQCQDLFDNLHNVYEFEDEEEEDNSEVFTAGGGFNVGKYLQSLSDESPGPGQKDYSLLAKEYLRGFNEQVNFEARLKQNLINMINENEEDDEEVRIYMKRRRRSNEDGASDESEEMQDTPSTVQSEEITSLHESNLKSKHRRLLEQQLEFQKSYIIKP